MQRLYYSDDGVKPTTFLQHLLVGDKAYVQRIQIVLGLLYTFTLVPPACPKLEYKFTVTRDRNKQYHMYQYTHSYTGVTQEGVGLKVGKTCKQFYEQQQTTEESCGQTSEESSGQSCNISNRHSGQFYANHNNMFSVATYNIWNLNNLPGEEYEDRLERLGKVSGSLYIMLVSYFHSFMLHSPFITLFLSCCCLCFKWEDLKNEIASSVSLKSYEYEMWLSMMEYMHSNIVLTIEIISHLIFNGSYNSRHFAHIIPYIDITVRTVLSMSQSFAVFFTHPPSCVPL